MDLHLSRMVQTPTGWEDEVISQFYIDIDIYIHIGIDIDIDI